MSVLDRFAVTDRVVVVTGASSGLGMHAALGLAEAGADLVVVARRQHRLLELQRRVHDIGRRCLVVVGDVAEPSTATETVEEALDNFGRIDVLLNNAGVGTAVPAIRETAREFRLVQDVNVNGSYWMAQACGRVMEPGSSIVNVASVLGFSTLGLPQTAYAASKAAVVAMTRDLAAQWTGRRGIRVNAIAPGFFSSEMTDQYPEGYLDSMLARVPAGRMGDPSDFAAAVVFLASDASAYVTGTTLTVDGGLLA